MVASPETPRMGEESAVEKSSMLTVELRNQDPVDLIDLTNSFHALAEQFQAFTDSNPETAGLKTKLFVREMRSGSIIADLISVSQQHSLFQPSFDEVAAFVVSLNDLVQFFLGQRVPLEMPSRKEAERVVSIMEPVAKDGGAQLLVQACDFSRVEIHQHIHVASLEANAVQNAARRFLGPALPTSGIREDELLVLEQVKNDASAKTGDRGIIESISEKPVKIYFSSESVKNRILSLDTNLFQLIFLVDVDVKMIDGKPILYRIIEVKDVIQKQ